MKRIVTPLILAAAVLGLSNCAAPRNNMQRDAMTGGAIGAAAGAIIGHQSGRTTEGALLGGALGAGTGAVIGNQKDQRQGY